MTNQIIAIEDGGGTDAATATASGTANTQVALTLVKDQVFERNESINLLVTTAGAATSTTIAFVQLENIH